MQELFRFKIDIDIAPLSPNQLSACGLRERIKRKTAAKKASYYSWIEAGKPKASKPVILNVVVRRVRLLDDDNVKASLKHLIDGCFKNAITPDDSPAHFSLGEVTQEIDKRFRYAPEVEFVVLDRASVVYTQAATPVALHPVR